MNELKIEDIEIIFMDVDKLIPFDKNPRKVKKRGIDKLIKSIETFGWTNPILIQKNTNLIIAGHQRLVAAKSIGLKRVPVRILDMDDVTAKAYNIADNKLSEEVATWDNKGLAILLEELKDNIDISLLGYEAKEAALLIEKYGNLATLDIVAQDFEITEVYVPCWIVIRGRLDKYKILKDKIKNILTEEQVYITSSEDNYDG